MALSCTSEQRYPLYPQLDCLLSSSNSSCNQNKSGKEIIISDARLKVFRITDKSSGKTIIEVKPKKAEDSSDVTTVSSRMALVREVAVSKLFAEKGVPCVIALEPVYKEVVVELENILNPT